MSALALRHLRLPLAAAGGAVLLVGTAGPAGASAPRAAGAGAGTYTYSVASTGCDGHIIARVSGAITVVPPGQAPRTERGSFTLDDESLAPCAGPPSTTVSLSGPGTSCFLEGYSTAPEVIREGRAVSAGPFSMPCTVAGVPVKLVIEVAGIQVAGTATTSSGRAALQVRS